MTTWADEAALDALEIIRGWIVADEIDSGRIDSVLAAVRAIEGYIDLAALDLQREQRRLGTTPAIASPSSAPPTRRRLKPGVHPLRPV